MFFFSYSEVGDTMLKIVQMVVKKVIFAFLLLYGLDLCVNSLNVVIPINLFTIGTVSCLGVPGLVSLIVMFFMTK